MLLLLLCRRPPELAPPARGVPPAQHPQHLEEIPEKTLSWSPPLPHKCPFSLSYLFTFLPFRRRGPTDAPERNFDHWIRFTPHTQSDFPLFCHFFLSFFPTQFAPFWNMTLLLVVEIFLRALIAPFFRLWGMWENDYESFYPPLPPPEG